MSRVSSPSAVGPSPDDSDPQALFRSTGVVTQAVLDSLNVEQARQENRANLDAMGGVGELAAKLEVSLKTGLAAQQVADLRQRFGTNEFPESPMSSYIMLLLGALSDPTLLVLLAAAAVSLAIGIIEDPVNGWIEGGAIFIAVFLVANIGAGNDYSKELQFRALESSSQNDERCSVLREAVIERINPKDLVVGDILVLQAGDMVPADCVVVNGTVIKSNESSLTGEPDDIVKTRDGDCFLLSACLLTEGEECHALVIGIGLHSQWGKIKANLVTEAVNTPLQEKLEAMTTQIGYIGMGASVCTFTALVISIWLRDHGQHVLEGFIHAFILSVTIIVVAIPEGLPLAVTISLAFSTKKMYKDQCFIRVLAACETMGNATNICSDKTGTLTENRMTVVEGWFGNVRLDQDTFSNYKLSDEVRRPISEQACLNRTAYLVYKDSAGNALDRPAVIGNKTEGALIEMAIRWGYNYEEVYSALFNVDKDRTFSFNSAKKRSTTVIHRRDGSVRLYCKGATEWVLRDCTQYLDSDGSIKPMTAEKVKELEVHILDMANNALRTLLLAHKDFASVSDLPADWADNLPDNSGLVADCIVGIIDPLRGDVKDAVATAQSAGVTVRMVTGDNVATARAIARRCGILTDGGSSVEGPDFRKMTPKQADELLKTLQVMARSSPDDKYLLVTRLNGHGVPSNRDEWQAKHRDKEGVTWEADRDRLLPGYREEWEATRPNGGEVVGVTGDGTNDAPALKAADVGLAMGITGTKVAQGASDIVILDDRFSSIVRAIMWGRAVYDNIRKFLQFQLTVNVVALALVFIGAVTGTGEPLNAVMMLWVNLVMDTFGALALGTEPPTPNLLTRRPYKRTARLVSRPMWRNILCQSAYQLAVCLVLLFKGAEYFGVHQGEACFKYKIKSSLRYWDVQSRKEVTSSSATLPIVTCADFGAFCPKRNQDCLEELHTLTYGAFNSTVIPASTAIFSFEKLEDYEFECLTCEKADYRHGSIIFNAFIFCQVFNEYTARKIFDEVNMFSGMKNSEMFVVVSTFTIGAQIFLIEIGGDFVRTSPLDLYQWLITIALGAGSLIIGVAMRFIPVAEDPNSFFNQNDTLAPKSADGVDVEHGRDKTLANSNGNNNKHNHGSSNSNNSGSNDRKTDGSRGGNGNGNGHGGRSPNGVLEESLSGLTTPVAKHGNSNRVASRSLESVGLDIVSPGAAGDQD